MIVVTGASRGIGFAVANRLAREGHEVLGVARKRIVADFPLIQGDVTSAKSMGSIAKSLRAKGKAVSGLVNSAGIASMNLVLTTPEDVSRRIVETNLLGAIFTAQAFLPLLIRNGGGSIINFSTIAVSLALKGEAIYAASKAGVEVFSRTLAREVADFRISVNCIAPGPIDTGLIRGVESSKILKLVSQQVIPRQATTEDIASLVDLMLDERFKSVSGEVISVAGR